MLDDGVDADARAIAQVLAGDREAFGVLVARYGRRVHDLARRILSDAVEAEDAVQQAFLNAFRALDRYDPRRPFGHWLLRITTNLCRNRLVARRGHPRALGHDPDEDPDGQVVARTEAAPPDDDDRRRSERVREALEDLPETYRMTAVLRYAHGLPLEAIAEITGEPLATVKTHLHRARAALRVRLEPPPAGGETPSARAGTNG